MEHGSCTTQPSARSSPTLRNVWHTWVMPPIATEFMAYVNTNEGLRCPISGCSVSVPERFEKLCNHLIQEHGLKCLHVGQETAPGSDGKPWQSTVAVFGK